MTLRIDPNNVLHLINNADLYAGENTYEIIQILAHSFLIDTDVTACEATLYYNNSAISNGHSSLFLSNEKKDNFFIFETIVDSSMTAISGQIEMWVEIKTLTHTLKTKPVKFNIKPSRKASTYKYTSVDADDLENKLLSIRNDCKKYYQMARNESINAKKCVQIMIDILKDTKGDI